MTIKRLFKNLSLLAIASGLAMSASVFAADTGKIKWFNDTKGYGFITPDTGDKDVFLHKSNTRYNTFEVGDTVTYDVRVGKKGQEAINVIKIK